MSSELSSHSSEFLAIRFRNFVFNTFFYPLFYFKFLKMKLNTNFLFSNGLWNAQILLLLLYYTYLNWTNMLLCSIHHLFFSSIYWCLNCSHPVFFLLTLLVSQNINFHQKELKPFFFSLLLTGMKFNSECLFSLYNINWSLKCNL